MEHHAADIAEKVLKFDAFERKVADLGFRVEDPFNRQQMRAWLDRERERFNNDHQELRYLEGKEGRRPQPFPDLTKQQLLMEPLTRALEEDRIRSEKQGRDRLLQKHAKRMRRTAK